MATDRLAELGFGGSASSPNSDGALGTEDVELGLVSHADDSGSAPNFMTDFFQEVARLKAQMSVIRHNLQLITKLHEKYITAIKKDDGGADELEKLMDETNATAMQVKTRLKNMERDNKEFQGSPAEKRIRTNMHGTLTRQFVDLMSQYQEKQTKYKNQIREKVSRQLKIVKPDATEEEVELVLQGDKQIFAEGIMQTQAKTAYEDIQARHKDITKLEASIAELHQLFVDMSVLVEAQGELLDNIEYSVSQSVSFTEKGVKELEQANRYQKKSRKKMCILIIIILVIMCVILFPVLAKSGAFD